MVNAAVLTLLLHAFTSNASLTELTSQPLILRVFFVLFEHASCLFACLLCFCFMLHSSGWLQTLCSLLAFPSEYWDYRVEPPSPAFVHDFLPCSITHVISSSQQLMQGSAHLVLQWREELWEGPALAGGIFSEKALVMLLISGWHHSVLEMPLETRSSLLLPHRPDRHTTGVCL